MDERYSTNATDFNSLLSQIKSKNVDAVLVAGHETEILNFIRQAKSLAVRRRCIPSRWACPATISARRWARMPTTRSA